MFACLAVILGCRDIVFAQGVTCCLGGVGLMLLWWLGFGFALLCLCVSVFSRFVTITAWVVDSRLIGCLLCGLILDCCYCVVLGFGLDLLRCFDCCRRMVCVVLVW